MILSWIAASCRWALKSGWMAGLFCGVLLLGAGGCQGTRTDAGPNVGKRPSQREIWNACYIGRTKVGYEQLTVQPIQREGRDLVSIEGLMHLAVKRFQDDTAMEVRYRTTETTDGKLVDFETTIHAGGEPQVTTGRVAENQLRIEMGTAGKKTVESIPWSDEYGGFLAVERSLWDRPMKPGESRQFQGLVPGSNQVGRMDLAARNYERIKLPDGSHELLEIVNRISLPGQPVLQETLWVDRSGEILRRKSEAMGLESLRVSKAAALTQGEQAALDLGESLSIRLDRPLDRPHETKRVRYRVRLKDGDPTPLFFSGPSQQVERVDGHTALVTVYALRPGEPADRAAIRDEPPKDADRKPNSLIESDDPAIVAMAQTVAGSQQDPWQVALALERHLATVITKRDYTQAFTTAAEVLKTHTGDCTEHAVLLAALARARGIPARVAMGLVYMPNKQALGYHMWTEVYVHNQWIAIDGTLGRGGIGAAHLKLAHHSLEGAAAYSTFLPIAQVAGKLDIEILEAQ